VRTRDDFVRYKAHTVVAKRKSCSSPCTVARSDDRATTRAKDGSPLRRGLESFAQRIGVPCAEDWSPLRRGLESFAQRILPLCATIVDDIRLSSLGRRCGRLRSSPLAALRSDSHPSPLLAPVPGGCCIFETYNLLSIRISSTYLTTQFHIPFDVFHKIKIPLTEIKSYNDQQSI
jgi:hypothetical protein